MSVSAKRPKFLLDRTAVLAGENGELLDRERDSVGAVMLGDKTKKFFLRVRQRVDFWPSDDSLGHYGPPCP
jgi:hypothetical protein